MEMAAAVACCMHPLTYFALCLLVKLYAQHVDLLRSGTAVLQQYSVPALQSPGFAVGHSPPLDHSLAALQEELLGSQPSYTLGRSTASTLVMPLHGLR